MTLELLPNEIFLDLFDYFDGVDLLRAFYGLNIRFNFLVYNQFQTYHFNFKSISKRDFDTICQQHLPLLADRVITLSLSGNDDTPEQISLFLSYTPSFNQFTHLRSLSVSGFRSHEILMKMVDVCHYLCNLTHLNFYSSSFRDNRANFQLIVNNIWTLPKLIHCYFGICIKGQELFCTPTKISSSLESVSIYQSELNMNEINRLFKYTPRLKHLSISAKLSFHDELIYSPLLTLTKLNIRFFQMAVTSNIILFLQNTPNLRNLDITVWSTLIDGYQWEQLIHNYLPKLKVFRFEMEETLSFYQNIQERADELIDSFQSSFWISEHQWFVQCRTQNKTIYLCTASNTFDHLNGKRLDSFRSTYPHDDCQELYNKMISIYNQIFFNQPIPSHIRFSNICSLWINLSVNDRFWSVVSNLNRLKLLTVSSHADGFQSQLQALLDRAPNLRCLNVHQDTSLTLAMSLFRCTNPSVRQLYLQNCNHCFNEEECILLSHSPLGIQCEYLSIVVNNGENIICLVKNMMHLRTLNVQCEDEKHQKQLMLMENNNKVCDEEISNEDKFVQWLKDHLPSTCLIIRDLDLIRKILIWI